MIPSTWGMCKRWGTILVRVLQMKAVGREMICLLNMENGVCFLFWALESVGGLELAGREQTPTHHRAVWFRSLQECFVFQELLALKPMEKGEEKRERVRKTLWC